MPAIYGVSGGSVVVYYIRAAKSKRLTLMENSASTNIQSTGAWQKILRLKHGMWQVTFTSSPSCRKMGS
jgi:hypothetical protein